MELPNGLWELRAPKQVFAILRVSPEFHALMLLARMVDALRFGLTAMYHVKGSSTPAANRQRVSIIHHLAATLNEIADTRQRHESTILLTPAAKRAFEVLDVARMDPAIAEAMGKLRNHNVFHFDPVVPATVFPSLPDQSVTIVTGQGQHPLGQSNDLADFMTFLQAFNSAIDLDGIRPKINALLDTAADRAMTFVKVVQDAVLERLVELGCEILPVNGGQVRP